MYKVTGLFIFLFQRSWKLSKFEQRRVKFPCRILNRTLYEATKSCNIVILNEEGFLNTYVVKIFVIYVSKEPKTLISSQYFWGFQLTPLHLKNGRHRGLQETDYAMITFVCILHNRPLRQVRENEAMLVVHSGACRSGLQVG